MKYFLKLFVVLLLLIKALFFHILLYFIVKAFVKKLNFLEYFLKIIFIR